MRIRIGTSIIILIFLMSGLVSTVLADDPRANPIEINGDKVTYSIEENKVTAQGNVSVIREGVRLYCDQVVYDRGNQVAVAEGNVVIIRGDERLTGDEMTFNLNTMQGVFTSGRFYSNPFYGAGNRIRRVDENHIVIEGGYLTTSDFDNPEYRLYAQRVDVYPNDKAVARHVRLKVGNLPIVYLPQYTQDLTEKEPALLMTPGYDKNWGEFLLSRWRYHLDETIKGNLLLDYRSRRGLAEGLVAKYKTETFGNGIIRTYYMNERRTSSKHHYWQDRSIPTVEQERFKGEWRHSWMIDDKTAAIWQFYRLSDDEFLKDYFEREYEKDQSPDTYFQFTRAFPVGTLSFLTDVRVNRFTDDTEKIPEVSYIIPQKRIADTNFYIKNTTTYSNFNEKTASPSEIRQKTMRVDNDGELSYPFKLGFVEIRPFAGNRQTYYSRTIEPEKYDSVRGIFRSGSDLTTKFFRVYDVQTDRWGLNIDKLRHVVSPSVAYQYTHDPTMPSSDLDQFDAIDSLARSHTVTLSLENKLQTKRGGSEADLLRLVVESDFRLKEDPGRGGFNNVKSDIEVHPYPWMTLYFDSEYDTIGERLKIANADLYLKATDRWNVSISKRYHVDVDDLLTTGFNWKINPKWRFRTYQRYDLETGTLKEQEFGIVRDLHTWTVDLNFNQTRGEGSEIWLVFTLKAFPEIGFDFTTDFNERKAGSQSEMDNETP